MLTRGLLSFIKLAAHDGFSKIVLYSDAKEGIDSINEKQDWAINSIIMDIHPQCLHFPFSSFSLFLELLMMLLAF